jgi:biopolymer transport protein ExbD
MWAARPTESPMTPAPRTDRQPDPKPDLTPMIDIVFNLIIFFMIVSQLSNLTVEQIELASASEASETHSDERVLQLNVLRSGLVKVNGVAYSDDPALRGVYPSLREFLQREAAAYPREESSSAAVSPSCLRINLRASKEAPFGSVQRALDPCSELGLYRTSFAASPGPPR